MGDTVAYAMGTTTQPAGLEVYYDYNETNIVQNLLLDYNYTTKESGGLLFIHQSSTDSEYSCLVVSNTSQKINIRCNSEAIKNNFVLKLLALNCKPCFYIATCKSAMQPTQVQTAFNYAHMFVLLI